VRFMSLKHEILARDRNNPFLLKVRTNELRAQPASQSPPPQLTHMS